MDEHELQDALKNLLEEIAFMDEEDREAAGLDSASDLADVHRVRTFEEEGVLTSDAGLVITMASGAEYQLTLVRSR